MNLFGNMKNSQSILSKIMMMVRKMMMVTKASPHLISGYTAKVQEQKQHGTD